MTYQQKFEASKILNAKMAELMEKVRNLAWKFAQSGCQTAERQARIAAMEQEYLALKRQKCAMWAA